MTVSINQNAVKQDTRARIANVSADLANATDATKGASLVGHQNFSLYDRVSGRVFAVKGNTQADILAARTKALSVGGGTILLPDATITLTALIPADSYVTWIGVPPRINQGVIPDNPWTFTGGTVLVGDGTFPAFAGNTTAAGSPAVGAAYGNGGIVGFCAENIGFSNFSKAIAIGATNVAGLLFGSLRNLWARECTDWAFDLINVMHTPLDRLFACVSAGGTGHGVRVRSDQPVATLAPGNMTLDRVYVFQGNLTGRGIVFEAATGAKLNEICAERLQCNRFSSSGAAQAATMTNASSTITVTDGSKYPVGMPVTFSATANGFTANVVYVVLSRSGNDITVGTSKSATAVVATGNTAVNIVSNGMPNVEIVGADVGGVTQSTFRHLDLEGVSSAQLYLENIGNCIVEASEITADGTTNNLVGRRAQYSQIACTKESVTDFDANCFSSLFRGVITTHRQRRMPGVYHDFGQTRTSLSLFDNSGNTTPDVAALTLTGGGVLQFNRSIAHKVNNQVGGAISLDAGRAGILPVSGAGPHTLTLPTITNASPQTSMLGLTFEIVNISSVAVTVNTDGTQVLNGQAASTSVSIAAGTARRFVAISTTSWALF